MASGDSHVVVILGERHGLRYPVASLLMDPGAIDVHAHHQFLWHATPASEDHEPPPRVLLTSIISPHPALVMGHNVQITYILWGIQDIEGRVLREEMVDAVGPIRRSQGRPRQRPKKLHAYSQGLRRKEVPKSAEETRYQEQDSPKG